MCNHIFFSNCNSSETYSKILNNFVLLKLFAHTLFYFAKTNERLPTDYDIFPLFNKEIVRS